MLSALFIGRIRHPEPRPQRSADRSLRAEIAAGFGFVVRHPLLRRIVACTGISNLFSSITAALLVLFALRTLGLGEGVVGLVFSAGAVGGLVGAVTAARFARIVGEGRAIPQSALTFAVFATLTPLAAVRAPLVLLVVGTFGASWGVVVYNVTQISFRQRLCPPALLGRMNASVRFLVFGTMPLGGLLGGLLGSWLGVLPTLWVAVAGQFLSVLPVALSPLWRMRELPAELDGADGPAVPAETIGTAETADGADGVAERTSGSAGVAERPGG